MTSTLQLVVTEVYNCHFRKIFDDKENISLIRDQDVVYWLVIYRGDKYTKLFMYS